MKMTAKQCAALDYIRSNPGKGFDDIADHAGASTSRNNSAIFVQRMVSAGLLEVVLTTAALEAIDEGMI